MLSPALLARPRLYLTGFMGSGKSTLGALLADRMGWAFADLDQRLEARMGMRVAAFFSIHGEAPFRELEAATLADTAQEERLVIATGGGTLARADNLATAKALGTVVYLRASVPTLMARLSRSNRRPLLQGPDGQRLPPAALEARIRELLTARIPFYEQADLVVDLDDSPRHVHLERLWRQVSVSPQP